MGEFMVNIAEKGLSGKRRSITEQCKKEQRDACAAEWYNSNKYEGSRLFNNVNNIISHLRNTNKTENDSVALFPSGVNMAANHWYLHDVNNSLSHGASLNIGKR